MKWKKILIIASLSGVICNTAMAAKGNTSIIPQLKLGTGEIEAGSIWGVDVGEGVPSGKCGFTTLRNFS